MAFENGLYYLLANDTAVSALVDTNIYFVMLPKGAGFPAIIINTVSSVNSVDLLSTCTLQERRVRFTCVSAVDQFNARALLKAVSKLLTDYTGTLNDGTVVQASTSNFSADLPFEVGAKGFAYSALLDVTMWIVEPS